MTLAWPVGSVEFFNGCLILVLLPKVGICVCHDGFFGPVFPHDESNTVKCGENPENTVMETIRIQLANSPCWVDQQVEEIQGFGHQASRPPAAAIGF